MKKLIKWYIKKFRMGVGKVKVVYEPAIYGCFYATTKVRLGLFNYYHVGVWGGTAQEARDAVPSKAYTFLQRYYAARDASD